MRDQSVGGFGAPATPVLPGAACTDDGCACAGPLAM